jgi:hypothetical protein
MFGEKEEYKKSQLRKRKEKTNAVGKRSKIFLVFLLIFFLMRYDSDEKEGPE